jgi:hypothetical protein
VAIYAGPRGRVIIKGMPKPVKPVKRRRRKRRALYPEPGLWVAEDLKGLPPIMPPGPLPNRPLTTEEVCDYVCYEGLGYCIREYIGQGRLQDRALAALWAKAKAAMDAVVDRLERHNARRHIRVAESTATPQEQGGALELGEETEEVDL